MQKNILNSMKKYWLNSLCKAGVALVVALSVVGCTKTEDTLGNDNFIPNGGDYKLYQEVIESGFNIKTLRVDSISSDNFQYPYLGTQLTKREGKIDYSFVTQCYPRSTANLFHPDEPFGYQPQIDSAFFNIEVAQGIGETDRRYTVEVYELTKNLPYSNDSTYYSNFDVENYIGKEPLLTINTKVGEEIRAKLPIEYVKQLMSYKKDVYMSVSLFHETLKGYYIKASSSQSGDLFSGIYMDYSGIDIHYHNKNIKPDTAWFGIYFNPKTDQNMWGQTFPLNKSFNIIKRDYNYKDPVFGVQYEAGVVSTKTYVSGMAGLMTELEIPESIIDDLKAKVASKGGSKILVSNATLVIPIGDTSLDGYDGALSSLGAYKQYQPIIDISASYANDVPFILEDYSGLYNTLSSFGGALSRATGEYRMNISSTIQGLVNDMIKTNKIQIAPSRGTKQSTNVSVLENSTAKPIRLELTYSVVAK